MATRPLTDIRPYVQPDAIGCPVVLVDHAIARAAIDFCAKSYAWRYTPDTVAAIEATTTYAFVTDTGTKVERVLAAWLDGKPLTIKNATDMLGVPNWYTETGTPKCVVVLNDSSWRLYPHGAGDVDMLVTLKPARDNGVLDGDIFEAHVETLAHGAKARLLESPGKPWSNPDLGLWHKGEYERGISDAEDREYRHAPIRTAPPPL